VLILTVKLSFFTPNCMSLLGDTPRVAAGSFSSYRMIELVIPKFIITPVCDTNK
jgi:hypothetical protein